MGELTARVGPPRPRPTIGVMGASGGDLPDELRQRCRRLGAAVARAGCTLITGACPGLPHEAVQGARSAGGLVVGISPAASLAEHAGRYGSPAEGYDVIVYTGCGLMGREATNVRSCDMVVITGGRSGTLGEFAIAYEEGKPIGVLAGSGGITELLPAIAGACRKDAGATLFYEADPERLVAELLGQWAARPAPALAGGGPWA